MKKRREDRRKEGEKRKCGDREQNIPLFIIFIVSLYNGDIVRGSQMLHQSCFDTIPTT